MSNKSKPVITPIRPISGLVKGQNKNVDFTKDVACMVFTPTRFDTNNSMFIYIIIHIYIYIHMWGYLDISIINPTVCLETTTNFTTFKMGPQSEIAKLVGNNK